MNLNLRLNKDEEIICRKLEEIRSEQLPLVPDLYISGGWVRDKVMGFESKDLDMCVADKAVLTLVVRIPEYFHAGLIKKQGYNVHFQCNRGSFKIEQAPIEGYDVHMIDLRDTDNDNIKLDIRKLKNNTVEDDLYTRDFTINSLYFSVKTGEVVDNCKVSSIGIRGY